MPNSPQSGFILGDPRAAGRDYQFYTGEVYKIWYRPWKSDSPHKLALGQRGLVSLGCLIPRLSQGWGVSREFESGVLDTSVVWWNLTQISWVEEVFPRVLRDSSGADTSSASKPNPRGKGGNFSPIVAFTHVVSTLIAWQSTKIRRGLSGLCADNPFSTYFF